MVGGGANTHVKPDLALFFTVMCVLVNANRPVYCANRTTVNLSHECCDGLPQELVVGRDGVPVQRQLKGDRCDRTHVCKEEEQPNDLPRKNFWKIVCERRVLCPRSTATTPGLATPFLLHKPEVATEVRLVIACVFWRVVEHPLMPFWTRLGSAEESGVAKKAQRRSVVLHEWRKINPTHLLRLIL